MAEEVAGASDTSSPTPTVSPTTAALARPEPPWSGWIETTGDALIILEAARRGIIPRVTRRPHSTERRMITSGSVFVFDEDESGIKRWTDGMYWSPSRISGNFLLYRETQKKGQGHKSYRQRDNDDPDDRDSAEHQNLAFKRDTDSDIAGIDKQREKILFGSLTNNIKFKRAGLMKKTFSVTVGGVAQHLVSYYSVEDVENGRLRCPSSLPELLALEISPMYLERDNFRLCPVIEVGPDGQPRYRRDADPSDPGPLIIRTSSLTPVASNPKSPRASPYQKTGRKARKNSDDSAMQLITFPLSSLSTADQNSQIQHYPYPQYGQEMQRQGSYLPHSSGPVQLYNPYHVQYPNISLPSTSQTPSTSFLPPSIGRRGSVASTVSPTGTQASASQQTSEMTTPYSSSSSTSHQAAFGFVPYYTHSHPHQIPLNQPPPPQTQVSFQQERFDPPQETSEAKSVFSILPNSSPGIRHSPPEQQPPHISPQLPPYSQYYFPPTQQNPSSHQADVMYPYNPGGQAQPEGNGRFGNQQDQQHILQQARLQQAG